MDDLKTLVIHMSNGTLPRRKAQALKLLDPNHICREISRFLSQNPVIISEQILETLHELLAGGGDCILLETVIELKQVIFSLFEAQADQPQSRHLRLSLAATISVVAQRLLAFQGQTWPELGELVLQSINHENSENVELGLTFLCCFNENVTAKLLSHYGIPMFLYTALRLWVARHQLSSLAWKSFWNISRACDNRQLIIERIMKNLIEAQFKICETSSEGKAKKHSNLLLCFLKRVALEEPNVLFSVDARGTRHLIDGLFECLLHISLHGEVDEGTRKRALTWLQKFITSMSNNEIYEAMGKLSPYSVSFFMTGFLTLIINCGMTESGLKSNTFLTSIQMLQRLYWVADANHRVFNHFNEAYVWILWQILSHTWSSGFGALIRLLQMLPVGSPLLPYTIMHLIYFIGDSDPIVSSTAKAAYNLLSARGVPRIRAPKNRYLEFVSWYVRNRVPLDMGFEVLSALPSAFLVQLLPYLENFVVERIHHKWFLQIHNEKIRNRDKMVLFSIWAHKLKQYVFALNMSALYQGDGPVTARLLTQVHIDDALSHYNLQGMRGVFLMSRASNSTTLAEDLYVDHPCYNGRMSFPPPNGYLNDPMVRYCYHLTSDADGVVLKILAVEGKFDGAGDILSFGFKILTIWKGYQWCVGETWRDISVPPFFTQDFYNRITSSVGVADDHRGVPYGGTLVWLLKPQFTVFCFDTIQETFGIFTPSLPLSKYTDFFCMFGWKSTLAVMAKNGDTHVMLVLRDNVWNETKYQIEQFVEDETLASPPISTPLVANAFLLQSSATGGEVYILLYYSFTHCIARTRVLMPVGLPENYEVGSFSSCGDLYYPAMDRVEDNFESDEDE